MTILSHLIPAYNNRVRSIFKVLVALIIILSTVSCTKPEITSNFEDQLKLTILDYMVLHKDKYSSFLSILKIGKVDKVLSAYNPNGSGYTLFLPDNATIDKFIAENGIYSSLEEMLDDSAYTYLLSRYHIVNMSVRTDDFPLGALPEYTLSGDRLTVSVVVEPDTSFFKINNQSPIVLQDVELSNGYINVISNTLKPIFFTTYQWIQQHTEYSIFKTAIDQAGLKDLLDQSFRDNILEVNPFTILMEADSVFQKDGIYSFEDLANYISPDNSDYTNLLNPLNSFLRYHILADSWFLADYEDFNTNYTTYSEIPILINGLGLDLAINKGKQNFDTIVSGIDTTIIDWIGFYYDDSNILTQSGVIHLIDQVIQKKIPSRASMYFQFYEDPLFNKFRLEIGTYIIEDSTALNSVKYSGTDLFFVLLAENSSGAWGEADKSDYLYINGDFSISYTIPNLVQGNYTVYLGADAFNTQNAVLEISVDGKTLGGILDLTSGGTADTPFTRIELGTINFVKYESHTISIKSLIPGKFSWDYMQFEPK